MIRATTLALTILAAVGCRETSAASATPGPALPEGAATAPAFVREEAAPAEPAPPEDLPAEAAAEAAANEGAGGQAAGDAAAGDAGAGGEGAEGEAAAAADAGPLPEVEIFNVGMHIGGEDNTAEQKRPIRAEVAKHHDAMRRCYAKAEDPAKKVTFGVDMRILGAGGPPKITNPRSGLKGEGVKECLVEAFSAIEFPRQPRGVDRMVSYSIEFRRK